MYIAKQLRKRSIAEYLLYMWQVEDLLRAFNLDTDRMSVEYIPQFGLDETKKAEMMEWYDGLVQMMREEGVTKQGHLQVNNSILIMLNDLHQQLLKSSKHPFYSAAYYKALPFIVELRRKGDNNEKGELENCFDALYGIMLLKAQKKEVSDETAAAIAHVSKLIAMLSDYYNKDKAGELEL